jgi:hypothetical protein
MSFRLALVCEDPRKDQYIARPILQRLLVEIGKPKGTVEVITKPKLRGISFVRALGCEILRDYGPIVDVVVFVIDADGEDGGEGRGNRKATFLNLLRACPRFGEKAVVVCGIQEVEVWALWGTRQALGVRWEEVRANPHPKEAYFEAVLAQEDSTQPGEGRVRLVAQSLRSGWASLVQGCPELGELAAEIAAFA